MSRFSEAYASILAELLGFEPISYWLDSSLGYFDVVTYSDIGYVSLCKYYALDKGLFRLSFLTMFVRNVRALQLSRRC